MRQPKYEVEFFEKDNGRCPTRDFLDDLSIEEQIRVEKALDRLEMYGRKLTRPHVGYLRDNIWELRVNTNRGISRLLYFFFDGRKFIITHGYKKKSRKVPDSEIDKAIEYKNIYLARKAKK